MKHFIIGLFLVAAFCSSNTAQAQYKNPDLAWGLSAGGAHGSNISGDSWVMQYRGFFQVGLVPSILIGQIGLGYTNLEAPGVYSAQTGLADLRLLVTPFTLTNLNPYLYAGIGVSKYFNTSGSDYLPMIPIGVGIQTKIARGVFLNFDGGYTLSLSDGLDGINRSNGGLNVLTNEKQDGFYGFTVGLAFSLGNTYDDAE